MREYTIEPYYGDHFIRDETGEIIPSDAHVDHDAQSIVFRATLPPRTLVRIGFEIGVDVGFERGVEAVISAVTSGSVILRAPFGGEVQ